MNITTIQGNAMVNFARDTIESHFDSKADPKVPEGAEDILKEMYGVFVTLRTYPANSIRGCIGYTEPIMPLKKALPEVALSSALRDPIFRPLRKSELTSVVIEVSIFKEPELIKVKNPKDYPKEIKIGKNGLMVKRGPYKALILPQIPVTEKWNSKLLLSFTCIKAGLNPNSWVDKETEIYKVHADVFMEDVPRGNISRWRISAH